ncbi:YkgJ family cysteine cluster protein [Pseudomonas sp. RP23018S]|uniref:YkgJ family cysteine cluster protein n=1 Tax=Pseudomonas sp. RP23018S TaxID=3096037 RepID=UPI002ACADDBF|nr:YkgJ family cysteine cluster protein [Pseudomonas sp. RP23018S]MDZ5604829.1 YkgJ family cysteine cluster protein [Pseudomonas sp. RP23018S]
MSASVRFACTGCGKCCNGHHVPLTLSEARQWAVAGGQVIVLIEGFVTDGPGMPVDQREHALRRSSAVACGTGHVQVAVTFAAFNPGRCRHLDAADRCGIYESRPLVCRIYPAEINPHIPLRTETKDCPAEAWEQGPELIHGQVLVDPALRALIEASRQADREDIGAKVAVCQRLGMTISALKGNGFTAWLPNMVAFAEALEHCPDGAGAPWQLHVEDPTLAQAAGACGLQVTAQTPTYYTFIGF